MKNLQNGVKNYYLSLFQQVNVSGEISNINITILVKVMDDSTVNNLNNLKSNLAINFTYYDYIVSMMKVS